MLKKLINLIFFIPLAVVIIAIAVANRHVVRLALDPLSPDAPLLAIDGPFFIFLFGALLIGVLIGGFAAWAGQGKWRNAAKLRSHEAQEWRKEAERLSRELATNSQASLPAPK